MPVQENAGLVVYNRLLLKILKKMEDFISAVRILLRNVIRVVTLTHSLIIETLHPRGFCFPAIRQGHSREALHQYPSHIVVPKFII